MARTCNIKFGDLRAEAGADFGCAIGTKAKMRNAVYSEQVKTSLVSPTIKPPRESGVL
ncbi:hypothetical protein IJ674_11015 [bacterium]|nr:hypothetical protein [bacterium]MBR1620402.1 hypothetical protein [bacterium]